MSTLVVVQARMGSTRLPGKVLMPLAGRPLLERMIERVRAARTPFELCVATTHAPEDEAIRVLCRRIDVRVVCGHETDLLDRHYSAARAVRADRVVKIPSDCPLIDPAAIDRVLEHFEPGLHDFVSNLYPPSWPDGNDVEVMSMSSLERAWRVATRPFEREHTTPFIWLRPSEFRCANVRWETGNDFSKSHRFTIDYPEDYMLIARIYRELYSPGQVFTLRAILSLLESAPEIHALNARHCGKSWHTKHLGEISRTLPGSADLGWRLS